MKYDEIEQITKEQLSLDGKPLKIGDRVWSYCQQEWVKIIGIDLRQIDNSCGGFEQSLIFAMRENGELCGFFKGFVYETNFKISDLHRVRVDTTFMDKLKRTFLSKKK